jgi:mRNA-degrading endonuclease RelE of RelBE toxin-antitoxin system
LIDAIEEALALLRREPEVGYPLRGRLRGLYSFPAGSYRIIYQLADNGKTVLAAMSRHRSVVYGSDLRQPAREDELGLDRPG